MIYPKSRQVSKADKRTCLVSQRKPGMTRLYFTGQFLDTLKLDEMSHRPTAQEPK